MNRDTPSASAPAASVLAARRARLIERFDGPLLIAAGAPQPRNYPANTHPFRASSHYLYFAGVPLPHAMLWIADGEAIVFARPHGRDDALWEGPQPSFDEIASAIGCPLRAIDELASVIRGRDVATLPVQHAGARAELSRLVGRDAGAPSQSDLRLHDAVIALRLRHDEAAVAELRSGAVATDAAHRAGMRATRPGILEAEVRAAMELEALRRGRAMAYGPIVTVHGEVLHNDRYDHTLRAGEMILADVGVESAGGWACDVTRTWPVTGRFDGPQRELYAVVLEAQKKTCAMVGPGVRYRDVHHAAARWMTEGLVALGILRGDPDELVSDGVYALLFPHGVGHLLGLDVHDMEDLGDRAGYAPGRERSKRFGDCFLRLDRDLVPGMAVTIEPGLYLVPAILEDDELRKLAGDRLDRERLARFASVRGIRIEDDVLVTETGREILTASIPKEIAEVEALVGA